MISKLCIKCAWAKPAEHGVKYPRVVSKVGSKPKQYPNFEE